MSEKKYTNVSKYATQAEATRAYEAYCREKGIPCSKSGFNAWCWEIAPECQEMRPFTYDEACHLVGREFSRKDKTGYFIATEVATHEGVVEINGHNVKDLLANWEFAESKSRCGVIVEE